jgi:surface polysaccharide O-acyltransferase-like enzyme
MHTEPAPPSARLVFLDWVRILAFFILVLYHVGMYYVSWDWHIKSEFAGSALDPFLVLSAPWRLGLLFLVSGAVSHGMLQRLGARVFLRRRALRLLLPLLFGVLVVVPPQAYIEAVQDVGFDGGYARFMLLFVSGYGGFCDHDGCLFLPTWNHLWFLPYLMMYCLVLAGLTACAGARMAAAAGALARHLGGWKLVVLPALFLALARVTLLGRFGETHMLVDDWFAHAAYLYLFLLGALLGRVPQCWPRFAAMRWPALALAATSWAATVCWYRLLDRFPDAAGTAFWFALMGTVYALLAWSAIVAACGFATRHLHHDGPARAYLATAILPVYIVHQTLIVVLAWLLKPARLAAGIEAPVLIVLTLTLSFGVYEAVRRIPLLRPLFGLPPASSGEGPRSHDRSSQPA